MRSFVTAAVVALAVASTAFAFPSSNLPCWRNGHWVKGAICHGATTHCAKGKSCHKP